jgi:ribonuclease VapC
VIVLDSSALLAIVRNEPRRSACLDRIEQTDERYISAATLLEAFIASHSKGVGEEFLELAGLIRPTVREVTAATAELACAAFLKFGKGRHPARLNFGDCLAYAAAKELDCPLLFIGDDFSRTDISSAL